MQAVTQHREFLFITNPGLTYLRQELYVMVVLRFIPLLMELLLPPLTESYFALSPLHFSSICFALHFSLHHPHFNLTDSTFLYSFKHSPNFIPNQSTNLIFSLQSHTLVSVVAPSV